MSLHINLDTFLHYTYISCTIVSLMVRLATNAFWSTQLHLNYPSTGHICLVQAFKGVINSGDLLWYTS